MLRSVPAAMVAALTFIGVVVGVDGAASTHADQNCLAWEASLRAGADSRGRPVIDRLDGDRPYGQILRDWIADDSIRGSD